MISALGGTAPRQQRIVTWTPDPPVFRRQAPRKKGDPGMFPQPLLGHGGLRGSIAGARRTRIAKQPPYRRLQRRSIRAATSASLHRPHLKLQTCSVTREAARCGLAARTSASAAS